MSDFQNTASPGIFLNEQIPAGTSTPTIGGPVEYNEFGKQRNFLPLWVTEAGEKTFAVKDKNGDEPFNAFVVLRDFDGQIQTLIPGQLTEESFTAYRYFTCRRPVADGSYSIDQQEINKPFTFKIDPNTGGIDENSFIKLAPKFDADIWPNKTIPQFDEIEKNKSDKSGSVFKGMPHEVQIVQESDLLRLDERIYQLLEKNNGVFLGERHDQPNLRQAVTYLMPALKTKGVGTISFEIYQEAINILHESNSIEDAKHKLPSISDSDISSFFNLVKAADQHGIKVLGHEPLDKEHLSIMRTGMRHLDLTKTFKAINNLAQEKAANPEKLAIRDEQSAKYIQENKAPGKIIIIGGGGHSTNLQVEANNKYQGLNRLLGLPSIDLEWVAPTTSFLSLLLPSNAAYIGATYKNAGAGSDFITKLMPDIPQHMNNYVKPGEYSGASWPPPKITKPVENVSVLETFNARPSPLPKNNTRGQQEGQKP